MLLGEIFQSIQAWQKLSGINLPAKLAYKILKYTKLVSAEHAIAEKQRVVTIREITETKEGQDATIEPDSLEFQEYVGKFNAIMQTESDLKQLDMDFEEVINAVDDKEEVLTVNDLAMLEPFFKSCDCDCEKDTCCDK